jgi:hypothetical protein
MSRRTGALAVLLALSVGLWPALAVAQEFEPAEATPQVILSGDALVPRGRVVGQVLVMSGSATVSGVVQGDVVVVDGAIVVSGQVAGSVVAAHGSVKLSRTAQVGGDVLAGGTVARANGAMVAGDVREGVRFTLAEPLRALGDLLPSASMAVSILLALAIVLLLAPRGAERVASAGRTTPGRSALWGVALLLLVPALVAGAALTLLGLPLALALLLGLGLIWLVGQVWVTWIVGRALVRPPRSMLGAALAGWAVGAAVGLVPLLNIAWWALGSLFGLGAMTVATWRARRGPEEPTLAPPPRERRPKGRHRAGRAVANGTARGEPGAPEPPAATEPDA